MELFFGDLKDYFLSIVPIHSERKFWR